MAQEQEIMSTFKRLSRINKEGGSMTPEERAFFEQTKKKSEKLEAQARADMKTRESNSVDFF